jgi:hypothetical protein
LQRTVGMLSAPDESEDGETVSRCGVEVGRRRVVYAMATRRRIDRACRGVDGSIGDQGG